MATRGSLGGLARRSAEVAAVIEASGKQRLLLETVGVGQDEVDIVRLADVTIVVLVPGMGDDVQSIKAGIMEIADIFVVNKSDRDGADRVEKKRDRYSLWRRNTEAGFRPWSVPSPRTAPASKSWNRRWINSGHGWQRRAGLPPAGSHTGVTG